MEDRELSWLHHIAVKLAKNMGKGIEAAVHTHTLTRTGIASNREG
jgi:hypothetical protein